MACAVKFMQASLGYMRLLVTTQPSLTVGLLRQTAIFSLAGTVLAKRRFSQNSFLV